MLAVVTALTGRGISVSVDTMHAATAEAVMKAGAHYINDVSGGLADDAMPGVMVGSGAPFVAMQWRGLLTDPRSGPPTTTSSRRYAASSPSAPRRTTRPTTAGPLALALSKLPWAADKGGMARRLLVLTTALFALSAPSASAATICRRCSTVRNRR